MKVVLQAKRSQPKKPVAGYFRILRAETRCRPLTSTGGQIEDYCRYKRLTLAATFEDIDFSGSGQNSDKTKAMQGVPVRRVPLVGARHRRAVRDMGRAYR